MTKQTKPKRMHLAYRRGVTSTPDTRCGTGNTKDITTDESLVTCELCRYWAHRGYTAPGRVEGKPKRREQTAEQKAVCRQSLDAARCAKLSPKLARGVDAGDSEQADRIGGVVGDR
jgi:hypothetical protein